MSVLRPILSVLKLAAPPGPQVSTVRYRYHAEKVANRHVRRYGYKEKIFTTGILPHKDDGKELPLPTYR